MTKKARITGEAIRLLDENPDGLRHSELCKSMPALLPPDIQGGYISNVVVHLADDNPSRVYKPAKGLFRSIKYQDSPAPGVTAPLGLGLTGQSIKEKDFYARFAEYLEGDLGECTKAIPLGGAKFKDKWGTPDVIGIYEPGKTAIITVPTEIVSAEIKVDAANLITAFGQAVAYKLFSHKSYIVVPNSASREDLDRLEALCLTCGIGLILFDPQNAGSPNFQIRTRAIKSQPDIFYVNSKVKMIEKELYP